MKNVLKKWVLLTSFCATIPLVAQNDIITETLVLKGGVKIQGYTERQSSSEGIGFCVVDVLDKDTSYNSNEVYNFSWKEIERIETKEREDLQLGGIIQIMSFKDGSPELTGIISSQVIGGEITFIDSDGNTHNIKSSNIASIKKKEAYSFQPIWEQYPLIEIAVPKLGAEEKKNLEGLIIEKNYASKDGAYIRVLNRNGAVERMKWSDLKEIQYKINPEYKPMFDAEVSDGSIFLYGDEIKFDPIDSSKPLEFSSSHSLETIEVSQDSLDNGWLKFKATSKQTQGYVIVPVEKVEKQPEDNPKKSDKKKKEESDAPEETVSYRYKISSFFSTKLSTNITEPTPRNTREYSFDMSDAEGLFALIRLEKKDVILINITK